MTDTQVLTWVLDGIYLAGFILYAFDGPGASWEAGTSPPLWKTILWPYFMWRGE